MYTRRMAVASERLGMNGWWIAFQLHSSFGGTERMRILFAGPGSGQNSPDP